VKRATKLALVLLGVCLLAGCRQQMAEQPVYKPYRPSVFFKDGQSARPLVAGTVARGHLQEPAPFFTGMKPGVRAQQGPLAPEAEGASSPVLARLGPSLDRRDDYVSAFPVKLTEAVLRRGQERFGIYCAVCHDAAGTGFGKIVERGFTRPPSFHEDRLREAPVGYFFDVITNGYGSMPPYAVQVPPADRWAIVAYVRALQLSRHAEVNQLPAEIRQRLEKTEE